MIDAQEAYNRTKYTKAIFKEKDSVELVISNAIYHGDYICRYEFEKDTPSYIKNTIIEWLTDLGYDVRYDSVLPHKTSHKIWIEWKQEEV